MSISAKITLDTGEFRQNLSECERMLHQSEARLSQQTAVMAERIARECEGARVRLQVLEKEIDKASRQFYALSSSVSSLSVADGLMSQLKAGRFLP